MNTVSIEPLFCFEIHGKLIPSRHDKFSKSMLLIPDNSHLRGFIFLEREKIRPATEVMTGQIIQDLLATRPSDSLLYVIT